MKVSISKIRTFKSCRRMYELKYLEGLEPEVIPQALEIGGNYHSNLEQLYSDGLVNGQGVDKVGAMTEAYIKYIYPNIDKLDDVEKWYEYKLNDDCMLVGRVDGIFGDMIVEHKTTSLNMEEYQYNLQWDEQILSYMLLTGKREILFTVCRKPTIRQKKNESDIEFFNRMVDWYETDTDEKIAMIYLERSDKEVEDFRKDLLKMTEEMKTDNFYRNTTHCRCWGRRCEYAPVCLNYDPEQEYFGFTKEEK